MVLIDNNLPRNDSNFCMKSCCQLKSCCADAGHVLVIKDGMPYIRSGRPVRIPLEDSTNIFKGADIKDVATMCHIQASKVEDSFQHLYVILTRKSTCINTWSF